MADIPSAEQKLNTDICTTQPENTEIYLNEYYCVPGYQPNDADQPSIGIPANTWCVEEKDQGPSGSSEGDVFATGVGNKRYLFDNDTIDKEFHETDFINAFTPSTIWHWPSAPQVADRFRAANGLFWTWNTDRERIVYLTTPSEPNDSIIAGATGAFGLALDASSHAGVRSDSISSPFLLVVKDNAEAGAGDRTARITLQPSTGVQLWNFFDNAPAEATNAVSKKKEEFQKLVNETISITESFYDHAFELTSPRVLDESNTGPGTMYYNIKPIYNYHVPQYEHAVEEIKESMLPNLYNILLIINSQAPADNNAPFAMALVNSSSAYTHYTNSRTTGEMRPKLITDFTTNYNTYNQGRGETLRYNTGAGVMQNYEYFEAAAKQYAALTGTVSWANTFNNILIAHDTTASGSGDNIKDLQAYNTKKDAFPMYMDIEFSTPSYNPSPDSFTETLKDTRLSCQMMKHIVQETSGIATGTLSNKQYMEFLEDPRIAEAERVYTDDTGTEPKGRRVLNIDLWFNDVVDTATTDAEGVTTGDDEGAESSDTDDNFIFLGKSCTASSASTVVQSLAVLDGAINTILSNNDRTFKEMLEGKKAATEIVLYKIEKKDINDNVVQNFYLPASESVDAHKFIDTQIKYGKEYTYTVYAWVLVYGMKYSYTDIDFTTRANDTTTPNDENEAKIEVTYQQDTKLIEVPYFEYTSKVLDTPPASPVVNIAPYYGVNNKLMFSLESGFGNYEIKPEIVEEGEASDITNFLISQNRTTQILKYSTDDFISKYRIYRLDFHPERYADFVGGVIRDISDLAANSTSIDEAIIPNKKYWYIFRSIDKHNHISYPSSVYQIELVDEGASIYPLIEVVEFTTSDTKATSKVLKKIMHIMPSLGHRLLPNEKEATLQGEGTSGLTGATDFDLGITSIKQETLWGKKFKIRLTSKKTGRKIDLNVEFKNEHLSD